MTLSNEIKVNFERLSSREFRIWCFLRESLVVCGVWCVILCHVLSVFPKIADGF